MSMKLEQLARDKDRLLACSALCRMQLRRQARSLRDSLRWRRVATAAVAAPTSYRIAFGLVVWWAGLARAARVIKLAGRIVAYTKLASLVIEWIRTPSMSPGRRPPGAIRQADPGIPDDLYGRPV